ncbi:hypothetical protein MRX96_027787 [Rhipicephalus microplus]
MRKPSRNAPGCFGNSGHRLIIVQAITASAALHRFSGTLGARACIAHRIFGGGRGKCMQQPAGALARKPASAAAATWVVRPPVPTSRGRVPAKAVKRDSYLSWPLGCNARRAGLRNWNEISAAGRRAGTSLSRVHR